jgi:hypothetical protein
MLVNFSFECMEFAFRSWALYVNKHVNGFALRESLVYFLFLGVFPI